jgi:maltooligosyltrehalose trehalohydrolase
LLSPHIPLLFMGDEYGEKRPFQFFTDFTGDLAEAVRKGRNEEFRNNKAFAEAFTQNVVPDPNALSTFAASVLAPTATARLDLVRHLITARKVHIVPRLAGAPGNAGRVEEIEGNVFAVRWKLGGGDMLTLAANLSDKPAARPGDAAGAPFFAYPEDMDVTTATLPPWSVIATLSV